MAVQTAALLTPHGFAPCDIGREQRQEAQNPGYIVPDRGSCLGMAYAQGLE